jgi:hypothetical protein
MPILSNYHHFAGRHWETGTLHNYYAYRGVSAPHTGQPYSEAFFLGISGGIMIGYFTFAYEGHDPHVALLTRNTFDPLNTMLARLGVVQEVMQTSKPEKGLRNLVETLTDGLPAIVWADLWSLPYNVLPAEEGMWLMYPILVYGYDAAADQVWIADRANVPLTVTTGELAAARGRVKQDKYRILSLDLPDPEKLSAAVTAGIWDCINLYTEKPPKGSVNNFGLQAFQHWADLLTKPKQRMSWEKEFPAGVKLYAGLTSTFSRLGTVGINGEADRPLYATFLEEAAIILNKPALAEVAQQFRQSGAAWRELGATLLPDTVAPLHETRVLLERKEQLFIEAGAASRQERKQIFERLQAIRTAMITDFPLTAAEVVALREQISAQVLQIRALEQAAVTQLRALISKP